MESFPPMSADFPAGPALSDAEAAFLQVPEAERCRAHLKYLTSLPHVAGTPGDYETAEYVLNQFKSFGLDAVIQNETVLLTAPVEAASAKLYSADGTTLVYAAALSEDLLDPTADTPYRNHSFLGYSPTGSAAGPLVYVNYGSTEDFEYLVAQGVNLTGAIAIARYGSIFRGLKALNAQTHGMAGLIIYSDPSDDGYAQGQLYPNGPWRPESGIQRGSVVFNSLCGGDPGRGVDKCGIPLEDLIPSIPVLPMGYGDAVQFLSHIVGAPAPASWQGALPFQYNIGPGAFARIATNNTQYTTDIWNVVAYINGTDPVEGEDYVILGNHRDAWVYGAVDPNSGTAALLEIARAYGVLLQGGWQPKRGLVLTSWDGEEYGLLGSTAFGERFADDLILHAVAYLNIDTAVMGPQLWVTLVPSLLTHFRQTAALVKDPVTGNPLSVEWDGSYDIMGSGSDYTVFLDALGVASGDLLFGGAYGVYHSVFDSFNWMETQGDPTFQYHEACAQIFGLVGLRLADARILPFNYTEYAYAISTFYLPQVQQLATDAKLPVDFTALTNAAQQFASGASKIMSRVEQAYNNPNYNVVDLNSRLFLAERQFTDPNGIINRKWFKHTVFAPDRENGYDASSFPGIVDMIRTGNATLAQQAITSAATALSNVGTFLSY
ncbi:prostate-specific membrane antigen [Capsaspora owczarzaki ATCC 30864]|uniref:Prostate-specific membrane antigen n=1 Tax=Capsaspora owczarzaki (strain ATCC 30864) TaxID=595528 RepID=A0A0D2WKR6_CAPO3|nr:prostate-specific membrane antigen [Capsaspora owczarzaki ATCC 30864]KJE90263.1 prostate-specific membrane antigen [Capsaspora owczarzaki ATCC 30864]|eukprot:XP_004364466.2 prostate-specific membrane antigen [Capsaspora owczarzaki ATCC 30864]